MLKNPKVDNKAGKNFTMRELDSAILNIRSKEIAGPNDIPPTFLKALDLWARFHLLHIFNTFFREGVCAQVWQNAIIIPLFKVGKQLLSLLLFCPVSLILCVVKTLERMIANRLYAMAEEKNWIIIIQLRYVEFNYE